jgi:hypothetical protein
VCGGGEPLCPWPTKVSRCSDALFPSTLSAVLAGAPPCCVVERERESV